MVLLFSFSFIFSACTTSYSQAAFYSELRYCWRIHNCLDLSLEADYTHLSIKYGGKSLGGIAHVVA